MKINVPLAGFRAAFQAASTVAPNRSPKPILANIKLVAADAAVLSATDLEVGLTVEVPGVEVEKPGEVLLPVVRFGQLLRESSDDRLSLGVDGQALSVRGTRSHFRFPLENPADFPSIAGVSEQPTIEVAAPLLKEMIRRTVFASDNDSSRYALGGALFEVGKDQLSVVATDGRRLAIMQGACKVHGKPKNDLSIIPTRALTLLERLLADESGPVLLELRGNDVLVKLARGQLYSRLVDGRFPKWRDVVSKRDGTSHIEMPVGLLLSAVRQAAIVTCEESRGLHFDFQNGTLVLSGSGAETGEARVELPIAFDGEVGIALDPRYFADFLKVLDPERSFDLEIKDSAAAAIFTVDDGYRYVLMPLAKDR